jgi:transposase
LSKKSWIVAISTPLADKISRYTLPGCDWKALLELLQRIRTRVVRELGRPVEMISCYEVGYDGFWLHRLLEGQGVHSLVIDPASVQVDRRARRAKTDRIDAERLLRSLMAYLRGEPKVWSVVRVPSVAEEDDRRLHRERDRLITERVQHVNRIKGLCSIHGIYDYEPMRSDRARLDQLRTGDGRTLPPRLKAEIARELQRLELVLRMLKEIDVERNAIASARKTAHTNAKKIQDLVKLKAIGPEIATVLAGEVFYRAFTNRRELASYVGLTPSHFQSGARCRDQGIRHQQGRQSQSSHHYDRVGLVVAASPTRQRLQRLVPRACRYPQGPYQTYHHRREGTQAADCAMALSGDRRSTTRCSSESLVTAKGIFRSKVDVWPWRSMAERCRSSDGSHPPLGAPLPSLPYMRDLGTDSIPTGYKLMRRVSHAVLGAPPWIKSNLRDTSLDKQIMARRHVFAVNPARPKARPCGLRGLTAQRGQARCFHAKNGQMRLSEKVATPIGEALRGDCGTAQENG